MKFGTIDAFDDDRKPAIRKQCNHIVGDSIGRLTSQAHVFLQLLVGRHPAEEVIEVRGAQARGVNTIVDALQGFSDFGGALPNFGNGFVGNSDQSQATYGVEVVIAGFISVQNPHQRVLS